MNLPERELNHPEWYARDLGACSQCSEPMLQVEDEGHHIIACRVCDLGGVADNDRNGLGQINYGNVAAIEKAADAAQAAMKILADAIAAA